MSCRAVVLSALLSMSLFCSGALADDKPSGETLIDLVQKKHDYKAAWGTMFKGEYSPPAWVCNWDANSTAVTPTNVDGKDFLFGSMCKAENCANDRIIVLFTTDHKKCWGLEITVPTGIGADAVAHPKKYAALRFFGSPDHQMQNNLKAQLEKDPSWK